MAAAVDWHPWRALHADDCVHHVDLGGDIDGLWDPDAPESIWLDRTLNQAARRSVLTHELVHRERGDAACCTPWHERHQERLVDAAAARRLIPLPKLVDALLWSIDLVEVAEILWVDRATLRARLANLTPTEHESIDERLWAAEGRMP